jgi:hypothetical protein
MQRWGIDIVGKLSPA